LYHQVTDVHGGEELSVRLLPAPGREGHEQVTERVEPLTGLQFPLHELYPSGKQFHEETVLLPFVFPVLDGRRTG
jgi:hypothetical protein